MDSKSEHAAIQPIIKKKKIVQGDDHHGGAWKVAYADFVTAMMAFFLLMWLLNATTEDQRKGIADYFNPTIPISRISGGGSDGLNGSSIFTEQTYARMGTGASRDRSLNSGTENGGTGSEDTESGGLDGDPKNKSKGKAKDIADSMARLQQALGEEHKQLSEHLIVKMSPEGIVMELVDSSDLPLFHVGRSDPTDLLPELLGVVTTSFNTFENDLKISGHTDNRQYRNGAGYDNWNLSADRANTARRLLVESGIAVDRIREVSGRADTDPLITEDPSAPQNRRISITILTEDLNS